MELTVNVGESGDITHAGGAEAEVQERTAIEKIVVTQCQEEGTCSATGATREASALVMRHRKPGEM